jgi:hypothetical protein
MIFLPPNLVEVPQECQERAQHMAELVLVLALPTLSGEVP